MDCQVERINRRGDLSSKESQEVRKGGEEDARGQPPCHTANHGVRRKESSIV